MNSKPLTKAAELFQRAQENARLQKSKKDLFMPRREPRESVSPPRIYLRHRLFSNFF